MNIRPIFLVLACSSILSAQADLQRPNFSAVRRQLVSHVGADDVPGLVVAVSQGADTLWEEAFGWSDREQRLAATPQTPFYVASISKTFTATALLHLAELGKLQLDDPANKYLGREKLHSPRWNASAATIRQLMTHTSGLTTFTRWCARIADPHCDIHNEIAQYGVLVWPPGKVFDYSNLGYGILGQVVANVSSQSFDSYLSSAIFDPLQMRDCGLALGAAFPKPVAESYNQKTHARSPTRISGHPGASGLYCSTHDLLLFGRFQLKQNLAPASPLEAQDIDQMHSVQPATDGNYGLGWWIRKESGFEIISAQGGTADAYALLELIPAKQICIVVLANSYSLLASGLERQILSSLLSSLPDKPPSAAASGTQHAPAPARMVGKWTGQIHVSRVPTPVVLEIFADATARVQLAKRPVSTLINLSIDPEHFYGELGSPLGLPDSFDHPFTIALDLALYGRELVGAAVFGPPAGEDGNQLPYFVTLKKVKP